jgi:heme A synthase
MPAASPGYRRLALATLSATFLLIVVGGIVRVSDSGLGCGPGGAGIDGWPLCRGDIVPGTDINAIVEYIHRAAASVVGVLWIALAVIAWRRYRPFRWLATGGLALVVAQGLLGAVVVDKDLEEGLVAGHLGLAMLLFALSIYFVRNLKTVPGTSFRFGGGFRALAFGAQAALFGAIVAGGYMAGSEKEGLGEWAKTAAAQKFGEGRYEGAHFACGHQFPSCNGGFLPFGDKFVNIHLTHRVFVYLATILVIALIVAILRRRPSSSMVSAAWVAAGLLVVQIVLGGMNVWLTDEYQALVVAHLTVATMLWATLTTITIQLVRAPVPESALEPPLRRTEPVAA